MTVAFRKTRGYSDRVVMSTTARPAGPGSGPDPASGRDFAQTPGEATRISSRNSSFQRGSWPIGEIRARVANFRAHQERFHREREAYCSATMAKVHASLRGDSVLPRLGK